MPGSEGPKKPKPLKGFTGFQAPAEPASRQEPSAQEPTANAPRIHTDRRKRDRDKNAPSEGERNQERLRRVNAFGKLKVDTIYRYGAHVYKVREIDQTTGFVKSSILGRRRNRRFTHKYLNFLKVQPTEITILPDDYIATEDV